MERQFIERRNLEQRAAIKACALDYAVILEQAAMRRVAKVNRDNRNAAAWEARFHAAR